MTIEQVWAVIVTAVVTGLVGFVFGYVKDRAAERKEEEKERHEHEIKREQLIENIIQQQKELFEQYNSMNRQIECLTTTVEHVTNGEKVLLRDRIIQACRVFIEKGYVTLSARANIIDMYKWYHEELGGNGLGETYFKRMIALEIIDDGVVTPHIEE